MAKIRKKDLKTRNDDIANSRAEKSEIIAVVKKMAETVMWFLHVGTKSSERYLKFLQYLCGFLGVKYFIDLFLTEWHEVGFSWPVTLILIIGVIYFLSILSVKQELDIAKTLFPQDCVPDELQFKDRFTITLQVASFMALYWFLGHVAQYISIVSFCMLLIACNDYITRRKININFRKYLADKTKYAPVKSDRNYEAIKKRREEIEWYLFKLPHLPKEAGRATGCAFAFCVAAYIFYDDSGTFVHSLHSVFATNKLPMLQAIIEIKQVLIAFMKKHQGDSINTYAYIILVATLGLNEIITLWWRFARTARLKKADL